jgi:hypothetical protein
MSGSIHIPRVTLEGDACEPALALDRQILEVAAQAVSDADADLRAFYQTLITRAVMGAALRLDMPTARQLAQIATTSVGMALAARIESQVRRR